MAGLISLGIMSIQEELPSDIVPTAMRYSHPGIDHILHLWRYNIFPTYSYFLAISDTIQQEIAKHAQIIAKTYHSELYTKAADELRLPYWDWADLPFTFPDVLSSPTVQVDTPFGLKTVRNPLFQYTFLNHPEAQEWFPTHQGGSEAWSGE
jgi:hypothetical protein